MRTQRRHIDCGRFGGRNECGFERGCERGEPEGGGEIRSRHGADLPDSAMLQGERFVSLYVVARGRFSALASAIGVLA